MFGKRRSFNHKRKIADAPTAQEIQRLRSAAQYGGNPEHKRNPGNFNLTPPASPRPDKTLCDMAGITSVTDARRLLISGIDKGLVSKQTRKGYPQNVWSVSDQGIPMEAQLENSDDDRAIYHGYPMPEGDPFRDVIMAKWNKI